MNASIRAFAVAAVLALACGSAWAQRVVTVAMVTDVSGTVKLIGAKGGASGVAAELPVDARLEVGTGGRLVVLVLATGDEYTLSGPVSAQVQADGLSGTPAERLTRRASSVGRVKLRGDGLAQAAVALRSSKAPEPLPLLSLAGTTTLETQPVFRWKAVDGAGPYRFELTDAAGNVLFETRTEATEVRLPSSVPLAGGKSYTWEVSTRRANGMRYANFGDFTVADDDQRARVAKLRPAAGASLAERVAFATWLSSQDLHDEARVLWRQLAAERPDDAQLKALGAR